jgi:hypothetical protein
MGLEKGAEQMTIDRLVRDVEQRLKELNLDAEEEAKRRGVIHKALEVNQEGFVSKDLVLPEGAILIGVCKGELKQAIARKGQLWIDGESFTAISSAAAKVTGRPTTSGWEFWERAYIPGSGFEELAQLRLTQPRKNGKRQEIRGQHTYRQKSAQ